MSSRNKGPSRNTTSRDDIGSTLTPAEKAREKKLRDDPMANVVGPLFIDCRRCGARIKLSPKSVYDPFHWKTHKERCLKKPPGAIVVKKPKAQRTHTPQSLNDDTPSISSPPVSPKPVPGSSTTPPLTPDKDDVASTQGPSDSKPDRYFPPPPSDTGDFSVDHAVTEYLNRAHRKSASDSSSGSQEHWQTWDWSHLKSAEFSVTGTNPPLSSASPSTLFELTGELPGEESLSPHELQLRRDAVVSLSLLSQSAPKPQK